MELLNPKGRIVSGLPCMYYLMNGVILFSEAVPDNGTDYHCMVFAPSVLEGEPPI